MEEIINNKRKIEIYTDASFKEEKKMGIYSFVIYNNNEMKTITRVANPKITTCTEAEIFGIWQAMLYFLNNIYNKNNEFEIVIKNDCKSAVDFYTKNYEINAFSNYSDLKQTMKCTYKKVKSKSKRKNYKINMQWISRSKNKLADSQCDVVKKKLSKVDTSIVVMKASILEELINLNKIEKEVLFLLMGIANDSNLIKKTQQDVAVQIGLSKTKINIIMKKFIKIGVLQKIKKGEYEIHI